MVTGDYVFAREAKSFVPNIHAAIVKWGTGRMSAKCLHPVKARDLIRRTAKHAIENFSEISPLRYKEPVEFQLKFTNSGGGDACYDLHYLERVDGRTVKAVLNDYPTMFRALRTSINVGGSGIR